MALSSQHGVIRRQPPALTRRGARRADPHAQTP